LAEKQDIIPANDGATQVLTNTGTAGEYGTKGIYDANGAYATQTQNLVDAATMNAGVQNAIDSEFQCIEWANPNDHSSDCLLMDVFGPSPQQIIPREYTQLEYIESTGTQYIDTGITPTNTTTTEVNFKYNELNGGTIFAALQSNGRNYYGIGTSTTPQYRLWYGSGGAPWVLSGTPDLNRHVAKLQNKSFYLDDILIASSPLSTEQNVNMYLFGANLARALYAPSKANIYEAKIWSGTGLVRNFIPARRNSDGMLGMYDTVSNTFFTNDGTGEFIAGPVVYLPTGE
jgi:hypothetical protein